MTRRLLLLCSLLLILAVGLCVLAYGWKMPARLARNVVLVLAGRGHEACTWSLAVTGPVTMAREGRAKDRLIAASRRLEKAPDGLELWDTPKGRWWVPSADMAASSMAIHLGDWEADTYGIRRSGVRPGNVVLDCGAFVGTVTRQALAADAARVVAIEPAPQALACLRRNFKDEISAGRVIVYPKALWNREQTVTFHLFPGHPAANRVSSGPVKAVQRLEVPATTVDRLVAELQLERVDFIKMDIEGAEYRALSGAQDTLRRWRPRMAIATYHQRGDAQRILGMARRAQPAYQVGAPYCSCYLGSALTGPLVPNVLWLF